MGRRKSTPRTPATGLQKLASESPFVWNGYRYGHDWDCPKCGASVFSSNYKGRLKLSQFSAQNDTRGISQKAQLHLVNGCKEEPRLPERKDLDN
jgi:hypothetical protein